MGRYGGEEFIIIAPIADYKAARFLAERLRQETERAEFAYRRKKVGITVSIGVSVWTSHVRSGTQLIRTADEALYRAKEQGRNRVIMG